MRSAEKKMKSTGDGETGGSGDGKIGNKRVMKK
jgi:hypothetical protein